MIDQRKQTLLACAAGGLMLAGAIFWVSSRGGELSESGIPTDDLAKEALWLCAKEGCAEGFGMTVAELVEHKRDHPNTSPPCPACGDTGAIRAARCPNCSKHFPNPGNATATNCPHCGKPVLGTPGMRSGG